MSLNRRDKNVGIITPAFIDIDEPIRIFRDGTVAQFRYRLGDPPIRSFLGLEFFLSEAEADRGESPITDLDTIPGWTIHPSRPSSDTSIETHNGYIVFTVACNPIAEKFYGRIAVSQFYNFIIRDECAKRRWQRGSVSTRGWRRA